MPAPHIKIPLHVVMDLARHLQWVDTEGYGQGLTSAQIKRAEAVIRRFVKTQAAK